LVDIGEPIASARLGQLVLYLGAQLADKYAQVRRPPDRGNPGSDLTGSGA
jgi:hypothetical protein